VLLTVSCFAQAPGTNRKAWMDSSFVKNSSGNAYVDVTNFLGRYYGVSDTTELKTFSIDSLGATVFMRGLDATNNTTNGGGILHLANESAYPIDNIEVFDAAAASKVWVREERLRLEPVNVLHAGAIPGDAGGDSTAFARAIALSYNSTTNYSRGIFVPGGKGDFKVHEIDIPTINSSLKFSMRSDHTQAARIIYDGSGGANSYLFRLPGMAFGGVENLTLNGNASARNIFRFVNATIDLSAKFDHILFQATTGDAVYDSSTSFTNWYMNKCRWDAVQGWAIYINIGLESAMERRPIVISNFTYDNQGLDSSKGFIKIKNAGGIKLKLDNARIEFNSPIGYGANSFIEEDDTDSGKLLEITLENIYGYAPTYTQQHPNYVVNTGTGRIKFNSRTSQLDNFRSVIYDETTSSEILHRYSMQNMVTEYGGNTLQSLGLNIQKRRLLSITNTNLGSNFSLFGPGDIVLRPPEEFLINSTGIGRFMVWPDTGFAQPAASNVSTTADANAGSISIKSPISADVLVGSNIIVVGGHYNGGDLYTRVDSLNLADSLIYVSDTVRTSVDPCTLKYQVPEWRNIGGNIGTSAPTSGNWKVGERIWNSDPDSTENIGWVCDTTGRAHLASTGDTHTNTTIDNVTNVSTWNIGDVIRGAGIPAGTIVTNKSGTTLTISQAATATDTGVALYDAHFITWGAID